jgi:hypothetical protein
MKNILFFLVLFISLKLSAQNWDLFPYKQKSYFNGDFEVMDSVKINGQDTILYFRKKLTLPNSTNCSNIMVPFQGGGNYATIDSLVQRNDSIIYKLAGSPHSFYFIPKIAVGQSWAVHTNNSYMTTPEIITITCSGIQLETFLGITDSVKTFVFSSNIQSQIDNYQMKLSKLHGLIELVPFRIIIDQSQAYPPYGEFTSVKIISIDSAGTVYGYHQPKFHDYFHLSVGDMLLWENSTTYPVPTTLGFFQDSITQVINSPDTVWYFIDRITLDLGSNQTTYDTLVKYFAKSEFGNIVETYPNFFGYGNNEFVYADSINHAVLWASGSINLSIDTVSTDTISSFSFGNAYAFFDTTNCEISTGTGNNFNIYFTVDTRTGISGYCRDIPFYGTECTRIKGSRVSGNQIGEIYVSVKNLKPVATRLITISPNPASDKIYVDNISETQVAGYEIYSICGKLIKSGNILEKTILINDVQCGLYFIHISNGSNSSTCKFIKE